MPALSLGQSRHRDKENFAIAFNKFSGGQEETGKSHNELLHAHLKRCKRAAVDLNVTLSMLENVVGNNDANPADRLLTLAQYNDALINTVAELSGETLKCRYVVDAIEAEIAGNNNNDTRGHGEVQDEDEHELDVEAANIQGADANFHFWGPIVQSALGVLLMLIIVGTIVMHFRMEWPWEYSLYWTVVTAFTVGYGDSPSYKYKCWDELANYTSDTEGYIYDADNLTYTAEVCATEHRAIADRPFDMFFVMIFACATVACATTLLTEFLEGLAFYERQRMALAKKVLLEAYISGRSEGLTDEVVHAAVNKEHRKIQRRSSMAPLAKSRKITINSIMMKEENEENENEPEFQISRVDAITDFIVNKPKLRWTLQLLFVMLIGIFYYMYAKEKGSFMEALYWVVISGLAVGYGDHSPSDAAGQIFCFFYIFVLVPHVYAVISVMVRSENPIQSVLGRSLSLDLMNILDRDHDGMVTKEEYLGAVLVMLEKTDFDTVDLILEHFNVLDQDGNGVLDRQDILMLSNKTFEPSNVPSKASAQSGKYQVDPGASPNIMTAVL